MNKFKNNIISIIFVLTASYCTASLSVPAKYNLLLACRILNTDTYRPHQITCEKYANLTQMKVIKESQEIQEAMRKFNIKSSLKLKNEICTLESTTDFMHQKLSPDQARERIEKNILNTFEGKNDLNHRELLELIKVDAQCLDDPQAIKSIQFVSENRDKTNMMDILLFWPLAWSNGQLEGFPIPKEIRHQPRTNIISKMLELSKK